jgi:serine palmitoyltransferase
LQIELKHKYKFRVMLDETWSFGVTGRNGRGVTEQQNVDPEEVDMIIGSLAGPLCAGGGFCAGTEEIVEHQRISAAAYTFSAALPAMLATTASETVNILQTSPEIITQLRENIKALWAQLDPRSDWVTCTSSIENPIMLLVLKPEVVASKRLSVEDQEKLLQDVVDEVCSYAVQCSTFSILTWLLGFDQWSPHHPPEKHASTCQCNPKGHWMAAATSTQSVCDDRPIEEGD